MARISGIASAGITNVARVASETGSTALKTLSLSNYTSEEPEETADFNAQMVMGSQRLSEIAKDLSFEARGSNELMEAAARAGWSQGEMAEAVRKVAESDEMGHRYSREEFHNASTLPAVVLINNGKFDDLTATDVQVLFDTIDVNGDGLLDFDEVAELMTAVLQPPCSLDQVDMVYQLLDHRPDGALSHEDFYKGITCGPLRTHLKELQKENNALKDLHAYLDVETGKGVIDRDFLQEQLRWAVSRDDAFKTLPYSIFSLIIFICLVIFHLALFQRKMVEDGMQEWVEGNAGGPVGPYLQDSVSDIHSMFGWLSDSGLPAVFGNCHVDARHGQASSCLIGSRMILIGDARLYQTKRDGTEESVWLLSADPARAILAHRPDAYLDAAMATVRYLKSNWADDNTMQIHFVFNTFGYDSQMFAVTDVYADLDDFGYVSPIVEASAVMIDPYPHPISKQVYYFIFDAFFLICLIWPLTSELKEICRAICLTGLKDACKSYWGLWNLVDWTGIAAGFTGVAIWLLICQAMHDDAIYSLLEESDTGELLLAPGVMGLNEEALGDLDAAFDRIISLFFVLRLVVSFNSVAIVLKFFKASQANPRLKIVIQTLAKASSDIFHWAVVFVAVFLGFAVTGHILFGIDLVQFRDFGSSIDSCFRTLMGEFEWYVDLSTSLKSTLPSGMPKVLLNCWFYIFMIFVLLILVNMLLAIVLEHYIELLGALKTDPHAHTVWKQTRNFIADKRGNKGFIPRTSLVTVLEDDDLDHGPLQKDVNEETLMETFPKMCADQATWLMTWLEDQARLKAMKQISETDHALSMVEGFVESITEHVRSVKLNVAVCTSMLRRVNKESNDNNNNNSDSRRRSRSHEPFQSPLAAREASRSSDTRSSKKHETTATVIPLDINGQRIPYSSEASSVGSKGRSKRRRDSKEKHGLPGRGEVSVKDLVDNTTVQLGSAVQDLQWQLTGAMERLANQANELVTTAQRHASATCSQPYEQNSITTQSPYQVSPYVSPLPTREGTKSLPPLVKPVKELPPCWTASADARKQ